MAEKKSLDIDVNVLKEHKIKGKNLLVAIEGTKQMVKDNLKLQNQLFGSDVPIFLQISLFKVPKKVEKLIKRLKLKHSLLKKDPDICLIVADLKDVHVKDHDKHVEHYEDLLRRKYVNNIKKIMTFHEFRTDYENFELRSALVGLYDIFLVDGRMSGKVVHKCGKIFYKKRKVPLPIKMQATNLKKQIDDALLKTPLYIHNRGNSYSVQIGDSSMKKKKLLENLVAVIGQLDAHVPGGFNNIDGLLINSEGGISVPVYKSLENPTNVNLKAVKKKKPKAFKKVKGELTTRPDMTVTVTPFGAVKTQKCPKETS